MLNLLNLLIQLIGHFISSLEQALLHFAQPSRGSLVLSAATELSRRKTEHLAENVVLCQQLIILYRQDASFRPIGPPWVRAARQPRPALEERPPHPQI